MTVDVAVMMVVMTTRETALMAVVAVRVTTMMGGWHLWWRW